MHHSQLFTMIVVRRSWQADVISGLLEEDSFLQEHAPTIPLFTDLQKSQGEESTGSLFKTCVTKEEVDEKKKEQSTRRQTDMYAYIIYNPKCPVPARPRLIVLCHVGFHGPVQSG